MPQKDGIYTITDGDVESMRRQIEGQAQPRKVSPTRRPSASVRSGPASDGSRALKASTLSLFVWGAGQMLNGQGKLGLFMLLTQVFAVAAHWALTRVWTELLEFGALFGATPWQMTMGVATADCLLITFMLANVYQAYRHAEMETDQFEGLGNPALSGLASLVVPGWGQLINGQVGKALIFLLCILSGLYVAAALLFSPFLKILAAVDAGGDLTWKVNLATMTIVGVAAGMWILSVYDAILVAGFRRRMI